MSISESTTGGRIGADDVDDGNRHYRPEIDGLRALAVLPVVLFHAGVDMVSGGFVGVDIFFVISGYLITGILYREISGNRFSILTFYERRIRRIVPNLLAALVSTSLVALAVLIPVDLKIYAQSVIATVAFMANIFFWLKIGYFTPSAEQFPLLHMWSLGVEEQYYLLFPLLMMVIIGRRTLKPVLWCLFTLSIGLSIYQVQTFPNAAFYLPFSRLWELMAGSLLAVGAVPTIGSSRSREWVAWAGILAIGIALLEYNHNTPFPGLAALLPCIGAVAIIHATADGRTAVGRILSARPLVFVGAISYSLYIWHWPIVVFTRYCLQRVLTPWDIVLVLISTFAIAIAAWKWIEQPWRSRTIPVRQLLKATGMGAGLLTGGVMMLILSDGWPDRYPASVRSIAMAPADTNPRRAACDRPSVVRSQSGDVCRIGVEGVAPTFALIGDSFGDAMAPGVDAAAHEVGISGLSLTQSGCAPLIGMDEPAGSCRARVEAMYELVRRTPSIRTILLVGRWPAMIEGQRFGLFDSKRIKLVDDQDPVGEASGNIAVMRRGFERSAAAVAPAQIFILTGVPEQKMNVPQAATVRSLFGGDLSGIDRAAYDHRQARTAALLSQLAGGGTARIIDARPILCQRRSCPIVDSTYSLYVDDNHPSRTSVIARRRMFMPALTSAMTMQPVADGGSIR